MHKIQRYGWKPDLPDARDFYFRVARPTLEALPPKVDMRDNCPPVYDQGNLGSCTANAIGGAHQFEQKKASTVPDFTPSRLFIYYAERELEGTIEQDNGAYIRDGMKVVAQQGTCTETQWPYDINQFRTKPPAACYTEALNHQVVQYMRVDQTLDQLKGCLAVGFPFVFGFTVYSAFEGTEVARTGVLNMPSKDESVMGGHAVMCVGYDDESQRFIVRNSWGSDWGQAGYFTIPYAYLTNSDLSADFWTIRTIEVEPVVGPVGPIPPDPQPTPKPGPCDWSLLFPAAKAFVDGAVTLVDTRQAKAGASGMGVEVAPAGELLEAGLRSLQQYMNRILAVRTRKG
jgi:C1A family cysteine protease